MSYHCAIHDSNLPFFGLLTKSYSARMPCYFSKRVWLLTLHARFFSFISLSRIRQRRGATGAAQRGSRQGGGLAPIQSPALHRRESNGTENLSHKKSSPGSSTRQGSLQSRRPAEGLANQPRGKGARRSRAGVETQQSEAPEENKKAEEIKKETQVGKGKARQSESERVRLWLKEKRKSEAILAKFTV